MRAAPIGMNSSSPQHHYYHDDIFNSSNITVLDVSGLLRTSTHNLSDGVQNVTTATPTMATWSGDVTAAAATADGPCRWMNGSSQMTSPWLMVSPVCSTRYNSVGVFATVTFIMGAITLWTILGNVLVLLALCRYNTLRTMSNCLIGNLAVSDLLLALTVMPISATNDLLGFWVFGDVMCTFWLCMDVLYCTASIWGLCTVAFDRYMATVYPVWYHDRRSVHKALGCIVFVWIFSAVISLAPFIGWRHTLSNFFTFNSAMQRHECVLFTSSSYVLYSAMGSFVIPSILMTFMYIRIFAVLHGKSKSMIKRKLGGGGAAPSSGVDHRNTNKRNRQDRLSNGCGIPELGSPDGQVTNGVERDFTTTTLVSVTMGSVCNLDNEENEDEHLESKSLLDSPSPQPDPSRLQIPSCLSVTPSTSPPLLSPYHEHQFVTEDEKSSTSPCLSRRSNSIALPDASSIELKSHSPSVDLERRHSHNVAFTVSEIHKDQEATPNPSAKSALPARLAGFRPNVQRSQSANVLSLGRVPEGDSRSALQTNRRRGGALSFLSIPLLFPRRSLTPACPDSSSGRRLDRNSRLTVSMKRRFEQREQRATKRMLLIMASFCVCWMPFLVMYVMRGVCETCYMNQHLVAAIIWLGYVNSSLNPVLYTLFNDDFKAAFKKIVGLGASPRSNRGKRGRERGRGKA